MTGMFNLLFATIVTMFADAIIKSTWQEKKESPKYVYFSKDCDEGVLSEYF